MSTEIERKLDAYEALTPAEQITLGKELSKVSESRGWGLLQALMRSTKANAALASLKDKERPREYYEGIVDMVDMLNLTIASAIANAQQQVEDDLKQSRKAGVLAMLRPGQGDL